MKIVVILSAIIIRWIYNTKEFFALPPGYRINDKECTLAGVGKGMIGSEDMAVGKNGLLFVTSGDLRKMMENSGNVENPGSIWVMNLKETSRISLHKLEMKFFPHGRRFQPHGIHISNLTDRMHVVSHNGDHSSVDIFTLKYNTDCWTKPSSQKCEIPVTALFLKSVKSTFFPNLGINDVVEKDNDEFYVSQYHKFSIDRR